MPADASPPAPIVGLVLTGGGARAAYQVGALRAIAELVPPGAPSPFRIVCGTSAGAINATAIAADATHFRRGVRRLVTVWKNFHAGHVYRSDIRGIAACGARWLIALMLGGLGQRNPASLLDNAPLARLLAERVDFGGIGRSIAAGALDALSVTASGYTSGESISFFQGAPHIEAWRRARRVGVATDIGVPHLMASSAIPFLFPAAKVHREYFGDGSMRQIAPISPALHLGSDRVMIISAGRMGTGQARREKSDGYPSLAQIAGHALNSIFLDTLEADLERLDRINRTVRHVPRESRDGGQVTLKHVDYIHLSPSEEVERHASRHLDALPRPVRFFLRGIGAMRGSGTVLASYLLFERAYCRALMRMAYRDTMARRAEIEAFLGLRPAAAVEGATPAATGQPAAPARPSAPVSLPA